MKRMAYGAACAALALGMCAAGTRAEDMVFVSFGGALQEAQRTAFLGPFAQSSGHKVVERTWDGGIGKISVRAKMGALDWDVVQLEGEDFVLGVRDGLFAPIDWNSLGGREQYLPQAVSEFGVGAILYSVALGYDASRLSTAPRTWADFFDLKKFPGRRALRKTAKTTMEIALLADGVRQEDVYKVLATPEGQARAFRKLDQIKASVVWWESGSKPVELLVEGKVSMAAAYNGRIAAAQAKGAERLKIQWDQNLFMRDWYVVMRHARNPDMARSFLRYINTPEVQARLPGLIPYGVPRKDVMQQLSTDGHRDLPTHPANLKGALAVDDRFWVEHGAQLERVFGIYVQLYAGDPEGSTRLAGIDTTEGGGPR
jgi:putative spermidine/putrescine transport system substrate-binding protein